MDDRGQGHSRGHGVGAGIALIFMAPVVLIVNVFITFVQAVGCAEPAAGQSCRQLGWSAGAAIVLPVLVGVVCIVAGRRGRNIAVGCWVFAVVGVLTLLAFA